MMKKLLSVVLALMLVLSLCAVPTLADGDVTLSIETALDGDTITYTISVNGRPADYNVAAMQFDVTPEAGVTLAGYETFGWFTDAEAYNDSVGRFTGINSWGIDEDAFTVMTLTGTVTDESAGTGITLSDVLIVDEEENEVAFTLDNQSTVQDTIEQTVGVTITADPQAVQAADDDGSETAAEVGDAPAPDGSEAAAEAGDAPAADGSAAAANDEASEAQPVDESNIDGEENAADPETEADGTQTEAAEDTTVQPVAENTAETSAPASNGDSSAGLIFSIAAIIIIALAVVIIVVVNKAKKKKDYED